MARHRSPVRRLVGRGVLAGPVLLLACAAYSWLTLPDTRSLVDRTPERTAFMELRAAEERGATPIRERRTWLPYARISPHLKRAVLVSEDAGFWGHDGVDYSELRASLETSLERGTALRGASTLTQQLAKNLYLSPSRNPWRKVVELMITRRLEAELSKTRIFELYLNVVEWGDGVWGAEAAARAHFGTSASSLTPAQAALMAGALINPRLYSPARPNARLLSRQRLILRRMGPGAAPPPSGSLPVDTRPVPPDPGTVTSLTAPEPPGQPDTPPEP